jgi:hypothetical protein
MTTSGTRTTTASSSGTSTTSAPSTAHIEFIDNPPVQNGTPYQRIFDKNQVTILEKEIHNLLSIGVIKQVIFCHINRIICMS